MPSTVTTTDSGGSRVGSLSLAEKARLAAFSLVALAIIALNVALTPVEVLGALFLSWGGGFGIHQVHDMVISGLLWIAVLLPFALMLYHPATG
ncbi:hypothetical protein ACFQL1_02925 [Halomicroarcula sp. GCM10025709]|uniref:hypothetical protein n=1 Tax=Halomicroarcula sp. GCM10025709 TaxID=3252669 RepID=UPI003622D1E7